MHQYLFSLQFKLRFNEPKVAGNSASTFRAYNHIAHVYISPPVLRAVKVVRKRVHHQSKQHIVALCAPCVVLLLMQNYS